MAPLVLDIKHRTHQVPWKGAEEISADMMVESEERGTRTELRGHMQLCLGDVATQGQTKQCPYLSTELKKSRKDTGAGGSEPPLSSPDPPLCSFTQLRGPQFVHLYKSSLTELWGGLMRSCSEWSLLVGG